MKYEEYSENTRKLIDEFAAERGFSREEILRRFEDLFHGREVSKHSRKIFV